MLVNLKPFPIFAVRVQQKTRKPGAPALPSARPRFILISESVLRYHLLPIELRNFDLLLERW